jgi:hypothetical protein
VIVSGSYCKKKDVYGESIVKHFFGGLGQIDMIVFGPKIKTFFCVWHPVIFFGGLGRNDVIVLGLVNKTIFFTKLFFLFWFWFWFLVFGFGFWFLVFD